MSEWEAVGLPTHSIRKRPVTVMAIDRPGYALVMNNEDGTTFEIPESLLADEVREDLRKQRRSRLRVWRNEGAV